MQLSGSVTIKAPRERVWDFVMDPMKVGQCGPGVENVEQIDDRRYRAVAKVGVGFITARFQGTLEITGAEPPNRAVLKASGQAPGSAVDAVSTMTLRDGEEPGSTVLDWVSDVAISGTIASVGARLIEGTANKLAAQTFDCIRSKLEV
jgi:carbon monoxide dehydrogenase subunit G